ncbi:hypothetical protein EAI_13458 [Harpegnathos saltator]|uniref:Uncharacterized protein n=2 Tax=Harpegnathos saltator TaxID=610380 RepID=E2BRD7_HARSA|nr:hypothetical protein EAI_13458 [Harpegnathos saltator]
MMDCGGDGGGLEDFVDLANDITDNSPTIRDAAERLLTLLGVDDGDNEDLVSSSEDEGVEVDIDELEDDDEETGSAKLLHHLAVSLAQELKYSSSRSIPSTSGRAAHQARAGGVEMLQGASYLERGCLQDQAQPKATAAAHHQGDFFGRSEQLLADERTTVIRSKFLNFDDFCEEHQEPQHSRSFEPKDTASHSFPDYMCLDQRLRTEDQAAAQPGKYFGHQQQQQQQQQQDGDSWAAGWDACANEALRYLVEDEGLPLHHPTVVAMKNHLDLQRERAFTQHTGYTEAKAQDMNLALD